MWSLIKLTLLMMKLIDKMMHQAAMLKHRPRLWWQFHKKYRSYADPMLELNSLAMTDMTEDEFRKYYRRLHNLRKVVYRSRWDVRNWNKSAITKKRYDGKIE